MSLAGLESYIFEDFAEVTYELLVAISSPPAIKTPWDVSLIVERFNTPEISDAIITHFKVSPIVVHLGNQLTRESMYASSSQVHG
jgi:hypothetical protein